MIAMSDDFNNSVSKTEREMKGYVEVIFTSSDAKKNAKVTDYPAILKIGNDSISINEIIDDDRKGKNYASLEQDYFQLDGTFVLPNNEASKNPGIGYVSLDTFENDKEIPINPFKISTSYTTQEKVNGITMYFVNNTPLQLEIQITSDGKTETFNESDCIINDRGTVQLIFEERVVDIINIYVKDVLYPDRRIRLQEVDFGISEIYEGEDLMSFKVIEQCNRFSDEIPVNECDVTIGDYENRFDVINPKGITRYLNDGVQIKPFVGVVTEENGISYCPLGIFWLDNWNKSSSDVQLNGKDIFNKLNQLDYSKKPFSTMGMFNFLIYKSNDWGININSKITDDSDYIIDKYTVGNETPFIEYRNISVDTRLVNLQKYGTAFGNVFTPSRYGDINYISTIKGNGLQKKIRKELLKNFEDIIVKNKIKNIEVGEYVVTKKTKEIVEETLFENSIKSNGITELIIPFDENKVISEMSYTGNIEIIEDNSDMWNTQGQFIITKQIYLKYKYDGTVKFTIKGYKDFLSSDEVLNTRIVNETGDSVSIKNDFLLRIYWSETAQLREHSNAIIDYRLKNQAKNTSKFEFNGDPSLELGDIIAVENKYPDENGNARYDKVWITKIESEFKGSFNQSIEGDIIE